MQTLTAIVLLTSKLGYPPTYKQIGKAIGVASNNTVAARIEKAVAGGYLTSRARQARTLRITDKGIAFVRQWQAENPVYDLALSIP